jgi:single-strand DNA-binding protein
MSYFNVNRAILVGRLTRDPELRCLPSGVSVCGLRVACSSSRKDPDGERREKPNFFDVSVYGPSAESVSRYTRKGSRVAVDGRLDWREWETADQQTRQAVSIVADTVQFLDSPNGRLEGGEEGDRGELDDFAEHEADRDAAGELVGAGARSEPNDLAF